MSEQMPERYAITDKMPAWMRRVLASENIPSEFSVENLTDRQKAALVTVTALLELEEKGIWYVNTFIFNCTTEKPEGVPLSFVLRKLVYQKVEDSFSISGDIQNATIGLLNSLSLIDSIKSNKE